MPTPLDHLRAGFDHHRGGRLGEAEHHYRSALDLDPGNADAHHLLAVVLLDSGRPEDACRSVIQALALGPSRARFHATHGEALRKLGRFPEARQAYETALERDPKVASVHNGLGLVCQGQDDWPAARLAFGNALALDPENPFVLNNLGSTLLREGKPEEAGECLEKALRLLPEYPDALHNLGGLRLRLGKFDEALALLEKAVRLEPTGVRAWHDLGVALHKLGRLRDAEAALREALRRDPGHAPSHHVLGAVLKDARLYPAAIEHLEKALALDPGFTEARVTLASVLGSQGKTAEARAQLERALSDRPSDALELRLALLLPVIYGSEAEVAAARARLESAIARLESRPLSIEDPYRDVGVTPFYLAYQGLDDRGLHARLAALYLRGSPDLAFVAPHCQPGAARAECHRPLRVGFLSTFFYSHTIGKLNLATIRHLDRSVAAVTLFTFAGVEDDLSRALHEAADRVVVLPRSLAAARDAIAAETLDVLYYTDVGMEPLSYFLAFARLAPLQCVTWGHPVTTGIPNVDVFLSAACIEPPGAQAHYTERLVRLPRFNACVAEPSLPGPSRTRADFGLPEGAHLYVCAQTLFKLHPSFDQPLALILEADPKGRLVFISGFDPHWDALVLERFRRSFPAHVDRVVFLPRLSQADFLHLQGLADVLLDTHPFGGGNTCYEAFACGTPVVTLPSGLMRGRLALGLYRQMGVRDCVAGSVEEYASLAVRLATDHGFRETVKAKILAARHGIYDDRRSVRDLEAFLLGEMGRDVVRGD